MSPGEWGPKESVRLWGNAGVTKALKKELEEERERAMAQLMVAAKASEDPRVRECFARYVTLDNVASAIQEARSVQDASK